VADTEVVKRLTIQGRSDGLDKVSSDLDTVSDRQKKVAASSEEMRNSILETSNSLLQMGDTMRNVVAANDNFVGSMAGIGATVADAGTSFLGFVGHTLTVINHLKLLGVAAYALLPSFRSGVNAAIGAAIPMLSALAPAATSAAVAIGQRLVGAFVALAPTVAPIIALVAAVGAAIKIFELGGQKIEEFNRILDQANQAGVSTSFFQRGAEAAKQLVVSVDSATEALNRFNAASTPQLGGSSLEQRLDALIRLF
jgi:hypothetical protein